MATVSRARALLREPLLHFLAGGLALFALHARVAAPARDRIVVSASFVEGLREEHARRTGSPPTADQERGLVERWIDEEVMYREALALGLDRGDLIVRRRLVQKMGFLSPDEPEPAQADLERWLADHPERYREPPSISFRHVFLARDRRGEAAAAEILAELRRGEDAGALGDPFLQGASFTRRGPAEIEAVFGRAFAEAIAAAPEGAWSGPIASSYGAHLVWIGERMEARLPPLAAVRARVTGDLLAERRDAAGRAAVKRLRERYRVEIEPVRAVSAKVDPR